LDDILDWESDDTGKPRYKDLQETKLNVLAAALISRSPKAAAIATEFFATSDSHGEITAVQAQTLGLTLRDLPEYKESLAWARDQAQKNSSFALAHLREIPDSQWRDLVETLTRQLLDRMQ
jgi:geranylgeranyl pyrophosphate synthase